MISQGRAHPPAVVVPAHDDVLHLRSGRILHGIRRPVNCQEQTIQQDLLYFGWSRVRRAQPAWQLLRCGRDSICDMVQHGGDVWWNWRTVASTQVLRREPAAHHLKLDCLRAHTTIPVLDSLRCRQKTQQNRCVCRQTVDGRPDDVVTAKQCGVPTVAWHEHC